MLAILGIVGGFFYLFYVLYWSGERVAQIELEPRGRSEELAVALNPEMTPVRAILELDYSGRIGGRIARYEVAIGGDEDARIKDIFYERGTANDSSDDSGRSMRTRGHNVNLGTFEVPREAGYLLRAEIAPSSRVNVEAARVTLTRNSAEWDFRIIGGLVAAILIGFGLGAAGRNRAGHGQ
ncbi:MAG: hypothetical protein U5L11_12205 [Arhodomonas sp.]|nr:hypothetical protein [Arhodomonas sp.]